MTSTTARAGLPARAAVRGLSRRQLAIGAAATAAVAAALTGLGMTAAADAWNLPAADQLPVDAAVGLAYAAMGAMILVTARAGAGTRFLGWVLLGSGLAGGLVVLSTATALVATEETPVRLAAVQLQSFLWVLGFLPLLTLVPLLYPDGPLPGRRWRVAGAAGFAGIALLSVGIGLYPEPFPGRLTIDKPVTSLVAAQAFAIAGVGCLVPAGLAGFTALILRVRRSRGLQRRQVVVLLAAAALLLAVTLAQPLLAGPAAALSQALAVAFLPVAIGVAVTRHHLYDLDLAVRRFLVVLSLGACLAGAYLTLFAVLAALIPGETALTSALAAGAIGVVVHPLAVRLSRGVDRMFYGDRADPYAVTARLSAQLAAGAAPSDVPAIVCRTIVESLHLTSAQLVLDVDGTESAVAAAGRPAGTPMQLDLRHRGERVGRLTVTPREGERAVPVQDAELLATLADQTAPAVAALQLHGRLQQSREALVAAREEERRRLRRDLHDGVGAAMAGVRLQLESARELVEDPLAGRLLDAASDGVAQAVLEIRQITDDLRPPTLDDLGLAGAVGSLADRLRTPALDVRVDVPALPALPAAVEVACYRIAAEALANAARHAGASTVRVSVALDERRLTVRVSDDGAGMPEQPRRAGMGMSSMRQRAEEIGGTFSIDKAGGVTVTAAFPLDDVA